MNSLVGRQCKWFDPCCIILCFVERKDSLDDLLEASATFLCMTYLKIIYTRRHSGITKREKIKVKTIASHSNIT